MKKIVVFLFLILLLLPLVHSLTASIGNAKAILRINASPEEPAIIERTILVNNKNEIPVKVTLTPTEEFEKFVEIIDKEFVLQPDESKKALFILTIDRGGTIKGNINVGFSPADPTIKENSVGLSSNIIILSNGPVIEDEMTAEKNADEENIVDEKALQTDEKNTIEYKNENVVGDTVVNTEKISNSSQNVAKGTTTADPLIGIAIIVVIAASGSGLFFGIRYALSK